MLHLNRITIWLAWIMLASGLFTLYPLGPYGLAGWWVATVPLLRAIIPRIGYLVTIALAVIGLGVLALASAPELGLLDLLLGAGVASIGIALTPPTEQGRFPIREKPHVVEERARLECHQSLARELGRARRHKRDLSVLSIALDAEHTARAGDLEAVVTAQLHVYCQVFSFGGRLLCIVPEVGADGLALLLARLQRSVADKGIDGVRFGFAAFEHDAVTGNALIEAADERRLDASLGQTAPRGSGRPSQRLEEVGS